MSFNTICKAYDSESCQCINHVFAHSESRAERQRYRMSVYRWHIISASLSSYDTLSASPSCFTTQLYKSQASFTFFATLLLPNNFTTVTYSYTHNHFTALWTLSRTPGWAGTIFCIFWCKMKIIQADAPTIWTDCHPHHFYAGCPS